MRVLVYTETYVVGGCDRYIADLAVALHGSGHELVFAGNPNPRFDAYLEERAPWVLPRTLVAVESLREPMLARAWRAVRPEPRGPVHALDDAPPGLKPGSPARNALVAALRYRQSGSNYLRLRALVRRIAPDVVHINNGGYPGAESCRIAALAARAAGSGVVQFVHNMAQPPGWPPSVERALDRRIDRVTALWLTAAERASDELHRVRGVPRERIQTVHYGLRAPDANQTHSARTQDPPVIAVVASFEPRKGHQHLIPALARLKANGVRARTVFVGEGERRDATERDAARLGLGDDVEFLGWRGDVDEILARSTLLVLPSTGRECLPYAILEAMAAGLPVVATDVAGIPEMVRDGENGRLVGPGDAAALAEAIGSVLTREDRGAALGAAGLARLRSSFSLEQMVNATVRAWDQAARAAP